MEIIQISYWQSKQTDIAIAILVIMVFITITYAMWFHAYVKLHKSPRIQWLKKLSYIPQSL